MTPVPTTPPMLYMLCGVEYTKDGSMSSSQPVSPLQFCEDHLLQGKRYNSEHHILPNENAVADRLLARRCEPKDAYEELHNKLHARPPALQVFLELLLSTAAHWSPGKIQKAHTARSWPSPLTWTRS